MRTAGLLLLAMLGRADAEPQPVEGRITIARAKGGNLADYTIHYIEWPHIDGQFERLFATMPGRWHWDWAGSFAPHNAPRTATE
jgi:hypothetical protein